MAKVTISPENVPKRAAGMLWMLELQFVLGMALNLIGKDATGARGVFGIVIFVFHVVIALGLLVNGALLAFHYKDSLARRGAWAILGTIVSGMLTVVTENDFFSFLMALGFLASAVIYVRLYERTAHLGREVHHA